MSRTSKARPDWVKYIAAARANRLSQRSDGPAAGPAGGSGFLPHHEARVKGWDASFPVRLARSRVRDALHELRKTINASDIEDDLREDVVPDAVDVLPDINSEPREWVW